MQQKQLRHSLESGNPVLSMVFWIPACAGMTIRGALQRSHYARETSFPGSEYDWDRIGL
jgi:hypothetical protein